MMLGELVPCGGGDPIPLLKPRLLIGRRSSCDVALRFPNISSEHCQLELINGYWFVRDRRSTNGIKVNGMRCDSKWLLPGDVLSIAKHSFEINYNPEGEAPPEEEDPFAVSLLEKAGLSGRKERDEPPTVGTMPQSARPLPTNGSSNGKKDEDDIALGWLSEGED